MSISLLNKQVFITVLKQRRKLLIKLGFCFLIIYFLFICSATKPTWEGLIDLLSNRTPPVWMMPSTPGLKVDTIQTKNYKWQKLAQLKIKTGTIKQDLKSMFGTDPTSWQTFQADVGLAGNILLDFWSGTIVTYQGQSVILGEGSLPINLNDRVLRWQEEIEGAAKKYDLEPALIAAVIEQESGGDPDSVSPVGALGLMQLMPSTAKSLDVNNPYDPAQNIDGGAHYLQIQLNKFGNLAEALAAYNAGPQNVENSTWSQIPETRNYVLNVPNLITKYQQLWENNQQVNTSKP